MNLRPLQPLLLAALASCASSSPYTTPPTSDDPWELIQQGRGWLERGRPRAALPSLQKAEVEAEKLGPGTAAHAHAKAAAHNELGRVYLMVNRLDTAEEQFLRATTFAESLPDRRPLHFDVTYNLSVVYEAAGRKAESCSRLQRAAALKDDLLAHPAEPPQGYGAGGERFIREKVTPRIERRARELGCTLAGG